MSKAFDKLQPHLEKAMALQAAMVLFEWDNETQAPEMAGPYTSKVIGTLSSEYLEVLTSDEVKKLVKQCKKDTSLTEAEAAIVREVCEELEQLECIPPVEYREFAELTAEATTVWANAKKNKKFEDFAPTLEKVISYQKKFASYRAKKGQKLYDVMLDSYEKGFDMKSLDQFFAQLKKYIVPLVKKAAKRSEAIDSAFLTGDYPQEKQEKAARFLAEYVGFDFDKGVLAVSAHPFTTNLHNHDVRITTHYTDKVDSSIFSVIHETGHALYELGIRDDLTQTFVGQGASMGMHEAQSRFFENIIGRNKAFWVPIYEKIVQIFPDQLKDISLDQFIEAVNKIVPGLIRTEADELTYCLHVMVRYEIEKMIVESDVDVKDLPKLWNDKYEEYLGIRPSDDGEGILQDIHWSQGSFGYFPSYALGSAFGAQLYYHMKKEMDIEGLLKNGKISVIRDYLRYNVHQYGKMKTSREILKDVTGEDFTPKYYIEYLTEKYGM